MDNEERANRGRSSDTESTPKGNPVERAAKALARREFFWRGGRIALGSSVLSAWLLAGVTAEEAQASPGSPGCWSWGDCDCNRQVCMSGGQSCPPRSTSCGGGQCWCSGCRRFCDWYCNGRPCHCSDSPNQVCC
jgi:hypothetical protein